MQAACLQETTVLGISTVGQKSPPKTTENIKYQNTLLNVDAISSRYGLTWALT